MAKKTIAFVVYPGVSLLELVGNHTLLSAIMGLGPLMQLKGGYESVVVGASLQAIPTDTPMAIIPQKTFADVPKPDGLVVIGGGADTLRALDDGQLVEYVRRAGASAEWVAAISTGSLLLAKAGLLEGRMATTHWAYAERLEAYGARHQHAGWVSDGKFTTAAGVSGAIDMALGLGAKLTSQAMAQFAQLLIEYDPHPPFGGLDWPRLERDRARLSALLHQGVTAQSPARDIAFVIYPGLTVFDLVGPLQVFSALSRIAPQFRPRVVAEQAGPITTDSGLRVVPNGAFEDVPHPYALFVPGGDTATLKAMANPAIRRYVRTAAEEAPWVVSVCTGALILAAVGLLDGCEVTTHWAYPRFLEDFGARYVQKRWTTNGKITNSAGVSAGIDTALYMVSRLTDEDTARTVQWLIHYDPQPPFGGIDYQHMKVLPRLVRGLSGLRASLYTRTPHQLTRLGR
jgi:transcriptional regulator GlxA family with amidase domain